MPSLIDKPQVSSDEDIVRAIMGSHYQDGEIISAAFRGPGTSVNRLAIQTLSQIFEVWKRELEKPHNPVVGACQINVGLLMQIGKDALPKPIDIIVVEDGTESNPSHALILHDPKLSRTLCHEIIKNAALHKKTVTPPTTSI